MQIPIHHLAKGAARFAINSMHYHLYGVGFILDPGTHLTSKQKDYLFELCVEMLEDQSELKTNPRLEGMSWHINYNMPFVAVGHVLFNLRTRCTGPLADRGWNAVLQLMKLFGDKKMMKAYNGPKRMWNTPLHFAMINPVSYTHLTLPTKRIV